MEDSSHEPVAQRHSMDSENGITKCKAYKICAEYLGGRWKSITSSEMVFQTVTGGVCNFLYHCSLPETEPFRPNGSTEPNEVLLRIYNQTKDHDSIINESVIFTIFSERKLGPKLYGVFPGGRLEEFIPSRALSISETLNPEVSLVIAKKLAQLHTLQLPICKEATWIFNISSEWADYAKHNIQIDTLKKEQQEVARKVLQIDYESEISWLKSFVQDVSSPVVFCHNDLHGGNMLLKDGSKEISGDNLLFIDFEFSNYNFRGYDIAAHFCERTFDPKALDHYPFFQRKISNYPSEQEQLEFVRAYLSSVQQATGSDALKSKLLVSEEHILREIKAYALAATLVAALWSIRFHASNIPFGYWEHTLAKMDVYYKFKGSLVQVNGDVINLNYKE